MKLNNRYYIFYVLGCCIIMATSSCKKDVQPQAAASLNVVNAVIDVGLPVLQVNYFGVPITYSNTTSVYNWGNVVYTVGAGSRNIIVVSAADTLHPVYNKTLQLEPAGIYSLFFGGYTGAIDTLLIKDVIPYRNDSTAGVRFVNLVPNSNAVKINIQGKASGSEVSGLPYKANSGFITYPVLKSTRDYNFEIRDAITDAVIANYSFTPPRFQNITLVFAGLIGGAGNEAPGIFTVNNY